MQQLPGIGFGGDELMGLNDTVFSILGPHNTPFYGEIQLIFDSEVMHHPNSYFLPCAGTYFNSNGGQKFTGMGQSPVIHRTWAQHVSKRQAQMGGLNDAEKRKNFMQNMWHCSVPGWWQAGFKPVDADPNKVQG